MKTTIYKSLETACQLKSDTDNILKELTRSVESTGFNVPKLLKRYGEENKFSSHNNMNA